MKFVAEYLHWGRWLAELLLMKQQPIFIERPKGLSMSERNVVCLRAWDRLSLCYQHLVSIRVVKIKPLYA